MSIADFPEILSQQILVGIILVGKLGVYPIRIARISRCIFVQGFVANEIGTPDPNESPR